MAISHHAFDPDLEPTTTGMQFKKYLERFKNYLVAINFKDKARKEAVKADNDQSSSSSNDGESTYRMEVVGSIEKGKGRRPIRRIKIEDQEIKVLIDTGSTVNVMDECTYREKFAKTCKLRKSTWPVLYTHITHRRIQRLHHCRLWER